MATLVARAWSLWKRSPSPMTCFQRANWPSTRALPFIAAVALPGHSPLVGDRLDVAVSVLAGIASAVASRTGIGTRWDDDHFGIWIALIQGGVHAGSVIAAVAQ